MWARLMVLGVSVYLGLSCDITHARGPKRVTPDQVVTNADLEGDATAIIQGCGHQPIVGFTHCRFREGAFTNDTLKFIFPPTRCTTPSTCINLRVFNQMGNMVYGHGFPQGVVEKELPWTSLLNDRTFFQMTDRGHWTWTVEVFWLDTKGRERVSKSHGDIILKVFKQDYEPLHDVVFDKNFVWTWGDEDYIYRSTSALRASVIPRSARASAGSGSSETVTPMSTPPSSAPPSRKTSPRDDL